MITVLKNSFYCFVLKFFKWLIIENNFDFMVILNILGTIGVSNSYYYFMYIKSIKKTTLN